MLLTYYYMTSSQAHTLYMPESHYVAIFSKLLSRYANTTVSDAHGGITYSMYTPVGQTITMRQPNQSVPIAMRCQERCIHLQITCVFGTLCPTRRLHTVLRNALARARTVLKGNASSRLHEAGKNGICLQHTLLLRELRRDLQ